MYFVNCKQTQQQSKLILSQSWLLVFFDICCFFETTIQMTATIKITSKEAFFAESATKLAQPGTIWGIPQINIKKILNCIWGQQTVIVINKLQAN